MFAAKYVPGQKELSLVDVPKPTPGPLDVILKVKAAGICHSDLHVLHGEVPFPNSFTMGHEACGEVVEVGSAVEEKYTAGELYAVHGPNPCGHCNFCRGGHDNLCNDPGRTFIGIGQDGAYAEYLKVPARNIVKVPAGISAEVAAVATDAVLTPYHAIKTKGGVGLGSKVLAIGLGGLGMNGIQIAVALGAEVTAVDLKEANLETAKKFGVQHVLNAKDISKLTAQSYDVVVDFVGLESTFKDSQTYVKPGGTILLVGLGSAHVPVVTAQAITYETKIQASFWGTHVEMQELYQLIAEGKIKPQVETAPLKEVNHWLKELDAGRIKSRMALIP